MELQKVLVDRRSIRDYTDQPVEESVVKALLHAASLAPSAVNQQPWAFAVVQDRAVLKRHSDRAKSLFATGKTGESLRFELKDILANPDFNIFYNANTLIVICAKPLGQHPDWDCCLAGENLMLAAHDMGLGTCPIGLAWPVLSQPDVKEELDIPETYIPVLPIIVGFPMQQVPVVERKEPEILCWIRYDDAT